MKVSIITTCYNRKGTIGDTIQSVLSQSYPDIEYIVIDGASQDGTMNIVSKYKDKIDIIVSEPDNGMYEAFNKGIKAATGDIIGLLHSDDLFFNPNTVEHVVDEFRKTDADLIYGNGVYITNHGYPKVKRVYPATTHKKYYLYFGWIPLHTTIYVKRELFKKYGLYDTNYSIASDYEISLRWFTNPDIKKHFLDRYLVKMRMGGKSTSPALQKKKSTEDFKIIRKYKLWWYITLSFKIGRKIPQYIMPYLVRSRYDSSY